ncbi:MAG: HEAT repeat domain-containing protein [Verrucomicrobia bacterium]|nr:HEAT repeat domain-containing protein [Verrucomicrobiota bacterium]
MKTHIAHIANLLIAISLLAIQPRAEDIAGTVSAVARYESGSDTLPLRKVEQLVAESMTNKTLRIQLENALASALNESTSFEGRRFICQQLAVIGTDACLPAINTLLDTPDTVGIACLALARNPSPKADTVLRSAALKLEGTALLQVVQTIGVRRDRASVGLLKRLAGSENKTIAGAAVIALGNIADRQALSAIREIRQRYDPAISTHADHAFLLAAAHLREEGRSRAAATLYEEVLNSGAPEHVRRGAFEGLLRVDRDGGVRRAMEAIKGSDDMLRRSAIAAVASLKGQDISKRFAALMPSLGPSDQALLVESLAARGEIQALPEIQKMLTARDVEVRISTIKALGQLGDDSTVAHLARILDTQPTASEIKALESALDALRGGAAIDVAITIELHRRTTGIRAPLLAALVRRANLFSFVFFQHEATGTDPVCVKLAFQGLSRTATAKDTPALLKALAGLRVEEARDDAEAALAQAFSRMNNAEDQSAAVRNFLEHETKPETRASLIKLLLACPDSQALAAVKASLSDANPLVREAAMRTLAEWPDISAWEPLSEVYRKAETEARRVVALRGLVRLLGEENQKPTQTLIDRYRALFASAKSDTDGKLILGTLARCAHPEALKLAVEQLGVTGVRTEASAAVRQIAEAIKASHPKEAQQALDMIGQSH